ncbi:LuxR family transcriptional regulator [Enterobacter ludwigii]|uniref:helix-turn-helix transcriptional regulator n=1 Tax=Enterobacter TaxID=547 RepID=UPI002FD02F75|nr:LuxR family transcriptional regulator [Enterobacter ludwigii]HDR2600030.1 LuxR family transcriptional regulator [Enterobacter ludwigii]
MLSIFNENKTIAETLREHISRKLTSFGTLEYAYTVISKKNPSDVFIISSYPEEWVNLYQGNNFQLTDPVILNAFKRISPFVWDENIALMSDLKFTRIFTLSRRYNIVNGFTFVLHDHMNNLATLSIIIDSNERGEMEARLSSERGSMQMLLIDINEQMYLLAGSVPGGPGSEGKPLLTQRENEVLYWASMGKTYPEIAAIAGISVSTVKFHMGKLVHKFGVSNARQAIRLGVELELIIPAAATARR